MYRCHILSWHRYIDDILILWDRSSELLDAFTQILNTNYFNLSFTMTCSQEITSFLDVEVFAKTDMTLGTTHFHKPTAGNAILRANSGHPTSLIKSIPYGQYLRIKLNCSSQEDFQHKANKLRDRLLARGYSKNTLKKASANCRDREGLVFQTTKHNSDDKTGTTKLIISY